MAAALEARIQQASAQVDEAVQVSTALLIHTYCCYGAKCNTALHFGIDLQKHKEERIREQERRNERDAQIEQLRVILQSFVLKPSHISPNPSSKLLPRSPR